MDFDFDSNDLYTVDDELYTTEQMFLPSRSEFVPNDYAPIFHPHPPFSSSLLIDNGSLSKGALVNNRAFDFPNEFIITDSESEPSSFSSSSSSCIIMDIPRSLSASVSEKMMKALSLFNLDKSEIGILTQVWIPIKQGNEYVLSTYAEPHVADENQMLARYREISRLFNFSTGCLPGLPGRVFSTKLPEWTSNVAYYTQNEYLRVEHAIQHEVRGSMAMPVFEDDSVESPCCAVLELVTVNEKLNFHLEMDKLCNSLRAVNLRSASTSRFHIQGLSTNQRAALADINDVLGAVCHVHKLPLALTWVPSSSNNNSSYTDLNNSNGDLRMLLCIEETACYLNDKEMEGFVHACEERYLEQGQGIAGNALLSNHPLFIPDVKSYDISQYPYVHHARKFGLNAVVAIRLKSTYTGDDHYIIELFLPINLIFTGTTQQQQLQVLNTLITTIQGITCNNSLSSFPLFHDQSLPTNFHSLHTTNLTSNSTMNTASNQQPLVSAADQHAAYQQGSLSSKQKTHKKRNSTMEKNISFNVLRQYFSKSLKDASKILGVCPTTLKRISRHHGIIRWPYRKIKKANLSLKSINNMISVEGVEGGLTLDPTTGGLVVAAATAGSTFSQGGFDVGTSSVLFPFKHRQPTSLGMIDSCNESDTLIHGGGCQSIIGEKKRGKKKCTSNLIGDGGSKLTVKASYKEDTIRFKMEASGGCEKLYEEIGKRLKLQIWTFNVKYLDDEEEWVMLVNDSDMEECLDVLDGVGSTSVKLLVGDITCSMGSSGYDQ